MIIKEIEKVMYDIMISIVNADVIVLSVDMAFSGTVMTKADIWKANP